MLFCWYAQYFCADFLPMTSAHLLSGDMRLKTFRVPCEVCKKMLAFTSVSRHMKTVHAEKIGKIWGCVECGKILQDEKRLTQHQTIHNPQSENHSFFSIVKTVTTKQNARTILLITEDWCIIKLETGSIFAFLGNVPRNQLVFQTSQG